MSSPFSISKYVTPLDPANSSYCIMIWSFHTTHASGKLCPGGKYYKIENGDQPIFQFLTGNKYALIHVSLILMCIKMKTKASIFQ